MVTTTVSTKSELEQIYVLNQLNLKQNLSPEEKDTEGFVSWLYSLDLLEMMHQLAPSIIAKVDENVIAYALTTLRECREFHPDLNAMFTHLASLSYKNSPLSSYNYYCMGQICIHKDFRGQGIVNSLYQKHKEIYGKEFDFILTEISLNNPRSQKAHEKLGFKTVHTYSDNMDDWNVVLWDWR